MIPWGSVADWAIVSVGVVAAYFAYQNVKELRISGIESQIRDFRSLPELEAIPSDLESEKTSCSSHDKKLLSASEAIGERLIGRDTKVFIPYSGKVVLREFLRISAIIHGGKVFSRKDKKRLFSLMCANQSGLGHLIHFAEGARNIDKNDKVFLVALEKAHKIYEKCKVDPGSYYASGRPIPESSRRPKSVKRKASE